MEGSEVKAGDFLKDVEITIVIRSGQTDLRTLNKLQQVIMTSVTSVVSTEIVLTELEQKVKTTSEGKLVVLRSVQSID